MFKKMSEGTKEEWDHISQEHAPHIMDMPSRVVEMLKQLESLSLGFGTNQLHHALQTATMAKRAGADDEMVLISLIHDMGKVVNVPNHGKICAEIIKTNHGMKKLNNLLTNGIKPHLTQNMKLIL